MTAESAMPHAGSPQLRTGQDPEDAAAAVLAVHGRGGSALEMLGFADLLDVDGVAWVAPQAAGRTWYPYGFMEPMERNQPGLDSALALLGSIVDRLAGVGLPAHRVMLLGFSQGACLASEFVARNTRPYGALVSLSGGLIGPDGTPRDYAGSLDGTAVFLGCSDVDPHIPLARVEETATVLERLGASVDMRIYAGMGHTVNEEELEAARSLLETLAGVCRDAAPDETVPGSGA